MAEWYYQLVGQVLGPVSFEELRRKANSAEIERETLVREGSDGPWKEASQIQGLFETSAEPVAVVGSEPSLGSETAVALDSERVAEADTGQEQGIRRSPLALRPCSDCGQMVSKQASTCPSCGRAFHESSFMTRYEGEQPVVIFAFLCIVGLLFFFLTPVLVYRTAAAYAPNVIGVGTGEEVASAEFGLTVAGLYVLSLIVCALLGAAVGRPRMAFITGAFLGLFFGPLGIFTAFAIDKRPQCPQCSSRLNGLAQECPHCHARLLWKVAPTWY